MAKAISRGGVFCHPGRSPRRRDKPPGAGRWILWPVAPTAAPVTASTAPLRPDADGIRHEIFTLVTQQARRVPLPVFLSMMALAAVAAQKMPAWMPAAWLVVEAAFMGFRYRVLRHLPGRADLSAGQKMRRLVWLNLVSASLCACSVLAFPWLSEVERAFFTVVLLGLCSGAVGTMAGDRWAFLAYSAPMLLGLAVMWPLSHQGTWLANADGTESVALARVIALLVLAYGMVLLALAQDVHRSVVSAWSLRRRERQLNRQLEAALAAAEEAGRTKARFLSAASHDLRQPLAVVNAMAAALSLRPTDDSGRRIFGALNSASGELTAQLESLIDACRLDTTTVRACIEPVNLSGLVQQHAREIAVQAEAKGLALRVDCPPGVTAHTDAKLLARMLRNLTHNALKYTDTGSVTLRLAEDGQGVWLSVADTGRGIPADQQARVFDEFHQIRGEPGGEWTGLGLGLSIVRRMAEVLKIEVSLQSAPRQGSTFGLRIPHPAG